MKTLLPVFLFVPFFIACQNENENKKQDTSGNEVRVEISLEIISPKGKLEYPWLENFDATQSIVNQISVPENYKRVHTESGSFQNWLQFLPLFPEGKKVLLHDGSEKWNQMVHSRVINIDVGKRDLQQCADAVMRLRAEYLFSKNAFQKIHFNYTNGTNVAYEDWRNGKQPVVKGNNVSFAQTGKKDSSYSGFKKYLIQIFSYAGTASLEKEMKSVPMMEMQIGDVLIQGGHPGHAIIVMDMAENANGDKIYLLAQSYMPAQNIHILKNPMNLSWSPWYQLVDNQKIRTPEWTFTAEDLKRFQ